MPLFPSLQDDARVPDVLRLDRKSGRAIAELSSAIMRQPSALSEAEREFIAAFVSGHNACQYCYGVHAATAKAYGVDGDLLRAAIDDLDSAPIDPRLKPIFAYVAKLIEPPFRLTQADADAVFAAGWDERALHDAIKVVCLYNFMNRLLDGHGVTIAEDDADERGAMLAEHGYDPLLKMLQD